MGLLLNKPVLAKHIIFRGFAAKCRMAKKQQKFYEMSVAQANETAMGRKSEKVKHTQKCVNK